MESPLLTDIVVIFALSVAVLFVSHRFGVPAIVGFFVTGLIAGPHGLGLVSAVAEVEAMAEIGIVLLLFTIGIEFSLERLMQIKRSILIGGSLQVILTLLTTFTIARQFGQPVGESIFLGFLVSLSSTAIVLKLIQERAEVDSPHGRSALGILIYQDIIIVPMILVVPLLTGGSTDIGGTLLLLLGKGVAIIALVILGAKWVIPFVLYQIARTQSRELFLLSVILICLGVAWITAGAGLSLALGAFLAGLIISESEFSHQALGNIMPFRDVFTSFFFISTGMLLNVSILLGQPGMILLLVLGVFALKSLIAGAATIFQGLSLRTGVLVGLSIGQIGEFSFVLSRIGVEHNLLSADVFQIFLTISVIGMSLTPFIIGFAPQAADHIVRLPIWPKSLLAGIYPIAKIEVEKRQHHLVIIGFGINGRNVARAARAADIPYAVIEMSPEIVRAERGRGEPIYFGDATQEAVLERTNIREARIAVIVINDPTTTRRITDMVRRLNPKVHLIVRTHYLRELKPLRELGADEVIPEEFETSVEIFARVLTKYLVPREDIERLVSEVRADGYEMFRGLAEEATTSPDLQLRLPDVEISTQKIAPGSALAGLMLHQSRLREEYEVNVLAIRRESRILTKLGGDMELMANDVLFILGSLDKTTGVAGLFRGSGGDNADEEYPADRS